MDLHENEISQIVFDCGLRMHRELGPGLLESIYEECLFYELSESGLFVERQKALPVVYKGRTMEHFYRVDLLLNGKVIVEVKACDALHNLHLAQVLTYLKLSKCRLGLLINFNVSYFKTGYKRVIHGDVAL
ncbi:GxxExxY protein [Cruoricaptor ignavus]|uniref:GxxExxY protein n=1 Tax=Cruoricaptor ignavus TaxID=1118202 RepID=A0A1M6H437_9FLAO|nr:GxxExxY protein [Cruoricaptor ignavus]SHJ16965.1 GxxExxY protein [Cruoricaptor ignavus]